MKPYWFIILFFVLTSCNKSPEDLPYIFESPENIDPDSKYPLIIAFHGSKGRGSDLSGKGNKAFNVLATLVKKEPYQAFLFAPQCPLKKQWVDTPWGSGNYTLSEVEISDELEWVYHKINKLIEKYPIDTNRIYLTGQSMGGFATWDLLLRYPDKFACAVPVCGGGDPNALKKIGNTPIWMFHGAKDKTVPVESSRELYKELLRFNSNVKYSEFKDVGHNSWDVAWENDSLISWMFKQKN